MNDTHEILFYTGPEGDIRVEVFFQDETLWLSQKRMAELFGVDRSVITKHLKNIFQEGELEHDSVCANFAHTAEDGKTYQTQRKVLMTMTDWVKRLDAFLQFNEYEILQDAGSISAKVAKELAEAEFEKFRVIQDQDFESDFDREVKLLKKEHGKD